MAILTKEQRNQLSKIVLAARAAAEPAAKKALHSLGVDEADVPSHLSAENRALRRALRAQAWQLGDKEDPRRKGSYDLYHLTEKIAYDQWHRMLFACFLAENDLLISPDHGVSVSLNECRELAPEIGLKDEWDVAVRFAAKSLPQIFRPDDPAGKIELAPEDRASLRDLVVGLTRETFLAADSLGWSYQFWQTERKKQVNEAGNKIGADELPAVTQLFTEDYMVDFLLDNTLGAWHAGKVLASNSTLAENAQSEDELRQAVSLSGCRWKYLRFIKGKDGKWTPAAGTFDGWPKTAEELKCFDPCMGSGHFVVALFQRLVALRMAEETLDEAAAVAAVIRDNLFGLEIDPRCTQIAAFNLALAAWRRVGYCALPAMNLACSGLAPNAREADWLAIAGDNQNLQRGIERLYRLFQKAAVLGSLINPRAAEGDLLVAAFHELQPLLEKALAQETTDDTAHEMAVTARGLAKAAEILASQFTLVATNVPYLGRGRQSEVLANYCRDFYSDSKADLAACFVDRCIRFSRPFGTVAIVTKQEPLFLGQYKNQRARLLKSTRWDFAAKLGPRAFETISGERVTVALLCVTQLAPQVDHRFVGLDASNEKSSARKAIALRTAATILVGQRAQLDNPDSRIIFEEQERGSLLKDYVSALAGHTVGDSARFERYFWEVPAVDRQWEFLQSTVDQTRPYGGKSEIIFWEGERGQMYRVAQSVKHLNHVAQNWLRGKPNWGKRGVIVNQMSNLFATLYLGQVYDCNCCALVPNREEDLPALWAYCSSEEFAKHVRQLDQKIAIQPHTLAKVPFDSDRWHVIASTAYPTGLQTPFSSDPAQWLFGGHPMNSTNPLQVGVARLVGYQWPHQTGSSFPDCPALGPDGLETLADDDGIICINTIKGEQPSAERLRALLVAAFGSEWTPGIQNELLEQAGFGGKTLEDWLRNGFFEQHCQLFHQRPFIWQIWDGRRDGFSALVNYHKLNRSNLEKLTYTFLGDWIARQKAANDAGEEGSDARLQAAQELKTNLEKIIKAEKPYDIFVRWKPIEKQPIGWEPDLNDGVRLNIRPFVESGVLRKDPKINWKKDRGKDVGSAPWYNKYDLKRALHYKPGDRINDYHLKLEEKRKARSKG